MIISIPSAVGELIDKITILEIKAERMSDEAKLKNVRLELKLLSETCVKEQVVGPALDAKKAELKAINEKLWVIEDDIRDCERAKDFGQTFIDLARAVYVTNDERAKVKKDINALFGSQIVEEKSYASY